MKIKLHYSLLGLLFIFAFTGLYIEILLFFSVIILHELGHLTVLLLFKQKVNIFNITIVGGILDVEYKDLNIIQEIIISLAGVFINFCLLIILKNLDNFIYQDILINYNLIMIAFNLLPIYPLDGFRLFEAIFRVMDNPFKEQRILNYISIFTLSSTFLFMIYYYKSVTVIVIFLFLGYHNLVMQTKYTAFVLKKYVKRYNYNKS